MKKLALKNNKLVDYHVPNFKEFDLKTILSRVKEDNKVVSYVPDLIKQKQNTKKVCGNCAYLLHFRSDFMQKLVGHVQIESYRQDERRKPKWTTDD